MFVKLFLTPLFLFTLTSLSLGKNYNNSNSIKYNNRKLNSEITLEKAGESGESSDTTDNLGPGDIDPCC